MSREERKEQVQRARETQAEKAARFRIKELAGIANGLGGGVMSVNLPDLELLLKVDPQIPHTTFGKDSVMGAQIKAPDVVKACGGEPEDSDDRAELRAELEALTKAQIIEQASTRLPDLKLNPNDSKAAVVEAVLDYMSQ